MRNCHGSLSQDRIMSVRWPCSSYSQDCLYPHVLAGYIMPCQASGQPCLHGYVHAVSSGHQHGAVPLLCQPVTPKYLTGVFIFPFHFYFRVFLLVHTHRFIFSHFGWCFLGLTQRSKSQILKMVLVEDKLVNPYKC